MSKKFQVVIGIIVVLVVPILFYFSFAKKSVIRQMINNPQINEIDALKVANSQALEQVKDEKAIGVRPIDVKDHIFGKIDAPVKIIVYSDYECPFCEKYYNETLKKIKENYADKVVIAYRHYFISSHRDALPASLASECAAEQGKFWEMSDLLYADAVSNQMDVDQFKKNSADLKLDTKKFNDCLDTEKYKEKIAADIAEAKESGVIGTPSSYVNGIYIAGARPFEDYVDNTGEKKDGMKVIIEKNIK